MNFVGIIAEYDPFHNGHAAQIAALRAQGARYVAVCLGAGASQRGSLPLLPAPVRAAAALDGGADLVVALPAPYACASAEGFASAGVRLLAALGCDTLAFGAETPDTAFLSQAAALLESADWQRILRLKLEDGLPFAAARADAAEFLLPGAGKLLQSPNNILAVEYCKAILRQGAPLTPFPMPRFGAAHGGETGEWRGQPIASASFLRAAEDWRPFVPDAALTRYRRAKDAGQFLSQERFSLAVLARLRGKTAADLAPLRGMGEGLEHRLAAALQTATGLPGLYRSLATKRYPNARLRRLVLDAALGIPASLPPPPFLHILGAKRPALPLLRHAALPASTSLADLTRAGTAAQIGKLHSGAVDFSALCRQTPGPMGLAFTTAPVLL